MASKLIDNVPTILRLPLRGLIGVTMFVLLCAVVIGIIYAIYWIGHTVYVLVGGAALGWAGFGLAVLFCLTWLGATMEDSKW